MITATIRELPPSPYAWKKLYDEILNANNPKVMMVRLGKKYGLISNEDGHVIVETIYDDIGDTNNPKVMWVRQGKKWGLVSSEDGHVIAKPIYDDIVDTNNPKVMKATMGDKTLEITLSE